MYGLYSGAEDADVFSRPLRWAPPIVVALSRGGSKKIRELKTQLRPSLEFPVRRRPGIMVEVAVRSFVHVV